MCLCRSKRVSRTDNSLTSSGMLIRVPSFPFDTCDTFLIPDAFSKETIIPTFSPRSEVDGRLIATHPEDAFVDLTANSIYAAIMLSIAAKIAF